MGDVVVEFEVLVNVVGVVVSQSIVLRIEVVGGSVKPVLRESQTIVIGFKTLEIAEPSVRKTAKAI